MRGEGSHGPGMGQGRKFMKKRYLVLAGILALSALTACGGGSSSETSAAQTTAAAAESGAETSAETASSGTEEAGKAETKAGESAASGDLTALVVGASPSPHAEILNAAADLLKEGGFDLQVKEYTDYVQPNLALDSGDLDANYFQHKPYLDNFIAERGVKLVSAGAIHYEPFGIYAGKSDDLSNIKDGAKIAVPNDVTNEARALLLLADNGIITLKDNTDIKATKQDITENPKNVEIIETEAAQIPRSLQDVDFGVINGNYALEAGLKVSDALAVEDKDSVAAKTYANVIAVREGDENSDKTQALMKALTSDTVKKFIEDTYEGAVVPIF